jgi:hypothetical protein
MNPPLSGSHAFACFLGADEMPSERIINSDQQEHDCRVDETTVDAKWMGARGDGTTDDTAALQLWLDDPRSTKLLTKGVYVVSTRLRMGPCRIYGEPVDTR